MALLSEIIQKREMIATLIARNLKIRYQSSALGFLWTLLNPLFMMLIYWIFIKFMKFPMDIWALLAGILAWQFLTICCGDSVNSVAGHPNLVKKIYFPRIILPLSTVLANLVNYIMSLGVLFILTTAAGALLWRPELAALPILILLQLLLCLGLALLISCSSIYFKDTEHIVSVLLMAWFFMSPVIYSLEFIRAEARVPAWLLRIYTLNPMVGIITLCRAILFGAPPPDPVATAAAIIVPVILCVAGLAVFSRYEPDFADEL